MTEARRRPTVWQWLTYMVGRPLPAELRDWVRHDLTGPHAAIRHVLRSELAYSPIFVVFLLFPGPFWVRALMVLLALLLSTFYTVSYMDQNRARRLEMNGLPPDLQSARAAALHQSDREAYEARYGRR
ncbi:DUF5313 family protein [Rhodococcus sp. X156]|uniref:DUF5313 family protein n=1 Tax=Rhodococcus sp. X156 TaxID=2499145 RepID=UPI000FD952C2|nr:DUF5313 family protein [Rhodococcus sp. X156]